MIPGPAKGASAVAVAALFVAAIAGGLTPAPRPSKTHVRPQLPAPAAPHELRTYAVALTDVQGLSAAAKPGTRLEVWVTWERRSGRRPRVQLLVPDAVLQGVAPPVTPGGSQVALIGVSPQLVPDVIMADLYGIFAVVAVEPNS